MTKISGVTCEKTWGQINQICTHMHARRLFEIYSEAFFLHLIRILGNQVLSLWMLTKGPHVNEFEKRFSAKLAI